MMELNLFSILTIISVFVASMLTVFFLFNKRGFILENRLLAFLLLIFSLQIFYSYTTSFYAWPVFLNWHKPLFLLRQTSFLTGPLMYFYVNAFLKKTEVFRINSLLHFLPFSLVVVTLMIAFSGMDRFVIWLSDLDFYTTVAILFHNLLYLLLSVRSMKSETAGSGNFFRNMVSSTQNRWIHLLLIGFILIWVVNLNSFALYMIIRRPGWCAYTDSIYGLSVFLFINVVMFIILCKPDIHYFIPKYRNSKLAEPEKRDYLQKVNEYMERERPYLNPDITLEILAAELSMNPRLLSQVINDSFKKNFKSFILEYRIRESMKILADKKHSRLTVLEILYQVGFNSKSAFNNQFKIYTNLTPLEFRAQAIG